MKIYRNGFGWRVFGFQLFDMGVNKRLALGEHFRIGPCTGTYVLGYKNYILMKLDKNCLTSDII